jgi:hypothetical protein
MSKISLVINTVSKNNDVWEMFFNQIDQFVTKGFFDKKYVFVDDDLSKIPIGYEIIKYKKNESFKNQFVSCIERVEEEFCIYISEDYILYDFINEESIDFFKSTLMKNPSLSFIRFMKGGTYLGPHEKFCDNLFFVPINKDYFYTGQAALWKTRDLELIHQRGPNLHIANADWENSFEFQATETCRKLGLSGLFCYYGEPKRGIYHYDSKVFPHVSTALVKGRWNLTEYPKIMGSMIKKYKIDIRKRGWV